MSRFFLELGARQDLDDHITYLFEEAGGDVAVRFVQSFQETAEKLVEHPEMGRVYVPDSAKLEGVRAFRVTGFPRHIIFYRIAGDRLQVERVLHASRDIWSVLGLED